MPIRTPLAVGLSLTHTENAVKYKNKHIKHIKHARRKLTCKNVKKYYFQSQNPVKIQPEYMLIVPKMC